MTLQQLGAAATLSNRNHHAWAKAWAIDPPTLANTVYRLTDLQFPATLFDGNVYSPVVSTGGGAKSSARRRQGDLDAPDSQLDTIIQTGLIDDTVLQARRLIDAPVVEYLIDRRWPWRYPMEIDSFWIQDVDRDEDTINVQMAGLGAFLQIPVGDNWGPDCRVRLFSQGPRKCNIAPTAFEYLLQTLLTNPSKFVFTMNAPADKGGVPYSVTGGADDGSIIMTSGALAGLEFDIKTWVVAGGIATVTLQEPLPRPILVADQFTLRPGCNKQAGRFSSGGHCKNRYANLLNFQGEDTIVGRDRTQKGIPFKG